MFRQWTLRKEVSIHLFTSVLFFAPFIVFQQVRISLLILFLLGVFIGSMLPHIDHLIYIFFLRPNELTSARIAAKFREKRILSVLKLTFDTREERTLLLFRTIFFQCLFVLFAFLVVSSSTSVFGVGLVLSFLLSVVVDHYILCKRGRDIKHLFYNLPFVASLDQFRFYIVLQFFIIFLLAYAF